MQRFVLFAMPRTGSSWLRTILHAHPEVICFAALFRVGAWKPDELDRLTGPVEQRYYNPEYRSAHPFETLEALIAAAPPVRHIGLKHMAGGKAEVRDALAADPAYRKIILRRDNLLAVYASNQLVRATGQGNVRDHVEIKRAPIFFDRAEFEAHCENYRRKYALLESSCRGEAVRVEYNRLRQGEDMAALAGFFGLAPEEMPSGLTRKRSTDDIAARFENVEEALAALKEMGREDWAVEGGECAARSSIDPFSREPAPPTVRWPLAESLLSGRPSSCSRR